jgi:hypothetical protein
MYNMDNTGYWHMRSVRLVVKRRVGGWGAGYKSKYFKCRIIIFISHRLPTLASNEQSQSISVPYTVSNLKLHKCRMKPYDGSNTGYRTMKLVRLDVQVSRRSKLDFVPFSFTRPRSEQHNITVSIMSFRTYDS